MNAEEVKKKNLSGVIKKLISLRLMKLTDKCLLQAVVMWSYTEVYQPVADEVSGQMPFLLKIQ